MNSFRALLLSTFITEFVSGEIFHSYYEKHPGKAIDGPANITFARSAISCVKLCTSMNPHSLCTLIEYNRGSNLCRYVSGGQASLIDVADENIVAMTILPSDTVDECASDPCLNGATCNNMIDAFSCTCVTGFTGTNCEQVTTQLAVFRIAVGCGSQTLDAWINGTNTTTDPACATSVCSTHYRDPIVDIWETLGITQVRYSIYKNDVEVAYVLFNGTGSTISSWFNRTRVLESSYSNMTLQSGMSCMDIDPGYLGVPDGRHFAIQNNVGSCELMDITHFLTIDHGGCCCLYDEWPPYPYIYYSTTGTAQTTGDTGSFDLADTAIIFVYM